MERRWLAGKISIVLMLFTAAFSGVLVRAQVQAPRTQSVNPMRTKQQDATSCPTITLSPGGILPNANVGIAYSQSITASGGTQPYSFAVTSGSLPPGLSLSADGLVSGTATTPGSYYFTVTATDATGCTGTLLYGLGVPQPGNKEGGGLYFGWTWPVAAAYDIQQLDMDLSILSDPDTKDILFFATQINIGTPTISTVCYYGIQTNLDGKGKGLIFSEFGTTDLSNSSTAGASGSWVVQGTNEGPFISLRHLFAWTTHRYILRLESSPLEDDAVGRWFHFYITDADTGQQTYIGALRFPEDSAGQYPSIMAAGFGAWIEHAHLVASPSQVPLWNVAIGRPIGNDGAYSPLSANWWFGAPTDYWQNSDIWAVGQSIYAQLGGDTQRTHGDTGSLQYCGSITLLPTTLVDGEAGAPYSATITATGGTSPYDFSVSSGTLPTGLSLSTDGLLSGTPTTPGDFTFTVMATDANNCVGKWDFTLTVTMAPPPVVTAMKKVSPPFTIVVTGSNLQSGIKAYINGSEWSSLQQKKDTKLKLTGGKALKAAVPKGAPTDFTFVNPDGGTATVTGWKW